MAECRADASGRRRGPGWLAALGWGLLALVLAAVAVVVTGACGLSLPGGARPFVVFCPPPASAAVDPDAAARLAIEQQREAVLAEALRRMERQLARVADCPRPPPRVAEAPPQPEPEPEPLDIPEDEWEERDIGFLEGCWSLINDMEITDIDTQEAYPVRDWRICFDESGSGEQTIVYENGTRCGGEIRADFLPDGRLRFEDVRDIECDGGFVIFRIINQCTRLPDGTADCIGAQPGPNITDIHSIFRRHESAN